MKSNSSIKIIVLCCLLALNACTEEKISITSNIHTFKSNKYHFGEDLNIELNANVDLDSVVVKIGKNRFVGQQAIRLDSSKFKYGRNNLKQFIYYKKEGSPRKKEFSSIINIFPKQKMKSLEFEIINEYPHSKKSFTQGLQFDSSQGNVLEGTGQYTESRLIRYKLGEQVVNQSVELEGHYFGEGITRFNRKIYQLTWKNKKGFIYDEETFEKLDEFVYPPQLNEGWGVTTDGKELIVSDGSSNLYFFNPTDWSKYQRKVEVISDEFVFGKLNELEYINGFIFANIWQEDIIVKINPKNGVVVGKIDLSELCNKYRASGVLNGIAFMPENNTLLITGKYWPKLIELKLKSQEI